MGMTLLGHEHTYRHDEVRMIEMTMAVAME